MTNNNNQELFERYFKMELTSKEVQDFKSKLIDNKDLNQQFHLYQLAHQKTMDLFHPNIIERKEKIKRDLLAFRQAPSKKQNNLKVVKAAPLRQLRFYQWLSAAAILLLIIAGAFIFQQTTYDTSLAISETEKHIVSAINLDAIETLNRSKGASNKPGSKAIINKNFKKILQIYNTPTDYKEANLQSLIGGIVYLEEKELGKAKDRFKKIIQSKKGQIDIAQWALVNVLLKQGNILEARKVLAEIKSPSSKKAEKILALLPKPKVMKNI